MTLSAPGHDDPDTSPGATRQPPSLLGAVKDLTSLLTALVGLLAVLGAVTEKFGAWIPGAERIPKPYLLLSAVVLLAVTLVLQKRRWLRRSELKKPDALILRPGEHLVGREEDTDTLLHFLSSSPLVWLVGESGSGKSSLLQAGLLPALRRDATKFAVFVDDWGADWIKGPEEALATRGVSRSYAGRYFRARVAFLLAGAAFFFLAGALVFLAGAFFLTGAFFRAGAALFFTGAFVFLDAGALLAATFFLAGALFFPKKPYFNKIPSGNS